LLAIIRFFPLSFLLSLPSCNWYVPSRAGPSRSARLQFHYGQVRLPALLPRSLPGLDLRRLRSEKSCQRATSSLPRIALSRLGLTKCATLYLGTALVAGAETFPRLGFTRESARLHRRSFWAMSACGTKRTCKPRPLLSALRGITDMTQTWRDVCS
jgi:hypothetical protein